jgi:hypothetical protein
MNEPFLTICSFNYCSLYSLVLPNPYISKEINPPNAVA